MHLSGKDVAKLDHNQLRRMMNVLLTVEANAHRVPLSDLALSDNDTVGDAGVDALIQWPASPPHDELAAGKNVVQYKSGNLSLAQLRKEFAKPGVQQTLREGGTYLFLVGHDYVTRIRDSHRKELARLCKKMKLPATRCRILYGDQIARWASRYLGVWALPEFEKPVSGFVTVHHWSQDPLFQNKYFADANRTETIAALREFVSGSGDRNVFRVEGPAGVGKSRLVLEALNPLPASNTALYAANADAPQVEALLAAVQSDASAKGIVVADECSSDRQTVLEHFARLAGARLRLICVGPSEILVAMRPGLTGTFQVRPLDDDHIRAVLKAADDRFPEEVVNTTVKVSGGFVKLALFVARNLVRQKVPLVELRQISDVRQILRKFVSQTTARTLEALSLLSRVGWDDELRRDAEALAKVIGLPFTDMQRGVKELKQQGVVLPRGRYLYVSPDLLAIYAAAELWDERGAELIDIVNDLPGEHPRRNLLLRLTMMAEHPEVRKAVERLLGNDGLFRSIEDLDDKFLSDVFLILSAALPRAAIETLKGLLLGSPRSKLLGFKSGRRNIMWALESLLRWPETSLEAARCVRELALAETEQIANNGTGVFCQYFQLFLSGSPLQFSDRLVVLDELLAGSDPTGLQLFIRAAAAALRRYETRPGEDEDSISRRPFPKEWRPRTADELHSARTAAAHRLTSLAGGSDDVAHSAREALIGGASTLALDGLMDYAIEILRGIEPDSAKQTRSKASALSWLLRHFEKDLTEMQRAALQGSIEASFGETLLGRMKRWVGPRLRADLLPGKGFEEADANARSLADVAYSEGLGDAEILWLCSREAENVWPFGKRLGELDTGRTYLVKIVDRSACDGNCVFLAAYVAGLASAQGDALWDEICGSLVAAHPILAFGVTFRGPATADAGQRILNLIENKKVPDGFLSILMYGRWVVSLPLAERRKIVEHLLQRRDPALTGVALGVLQDWLESEPSAAAEQRDLIWKALEQPLAASDDAGWHWGEIAKTAVSLEPTRVASLAIDKMTDEASWIRFQDIGRAVLDAATKVDTDAVFDTVSRALLHRGNSHRLAFALEHWYGDIVPAASLVKWARSNPSARSIAPRLISVDGIPMPERLRALLKAFPNDRDLMRSALASLGTGSWWGLYSGRLKMERDVLKSWSAEQDPSIRNWAEKMVRRTERMIERQLKIEEEQGISGIQTTSAEPSKTAA